MCHLHGHILGPADLLRSWAAPAADFVPQGLHTAPATQINLRPAQREYGAYNFGRPAALSIYGGSTTTRHPSRELDESSHLDSQDFSGVDLQLGLEGFGEGDESIEIGRERQVALSREGSVRANIGKRAESFGMPEEMDVGFEPMDLQLDFDQPVPNLDVRSRRESTFSSFMQSHLKVTS